MLQVWLLGGASAIDAPRPVPAKVPRWISALVLLLAAAAITIGLILAAFGLFAALRIAYGYGNSVERASTVAPFGSNGWQGKPGSTTDRITSVPLAAPVLARSESTEAEPVNDAHTRQSATPVGNAERNPTDQERAPTSPVAPAESAVADVPVAAPSEPVAGAAVDREATGGADRLAALPPAKESAAAPPHQVKRHPVVKRPAARKRVHRVARRSMYSNSMANPFQPMFGSSGFSSR